jgi:hypothetical protein
LLAAIVVYAVAAGDRLRDVVAGVGALGFLLAVAALAARRPSVFPAALAAVGGAYGTFVALEPEELDRWSPLVAATLFVAAELGYRALERDTARGSASVAARQAVALSGAALATALVAASVLGLTSGVTGGIVLEAAGVGAAVLMLAAIAWLTARSRRSV